MTVRRGRVTRWTEKLRVEGKTAIGHVSCYCLLGTGAFRAVVIILRDRGDSIDYLHSFCVSKIPLI